MSAWRRMAAAGLLLAAAASGGEQRYLLVIGGKGCEVESVDPAVLAAHPARKTADNSLLARGERRPSGKREAIAVEVAPTRASLLVDAWPLQADGAIIVCDAEYVPKSKLAFKRGHVTGIALPELDKAKEIDIRTPREAILPPARIAVRFEAEIVGHGPASDGDGTFEDLSSDWAAGILGSTRSFKVEIEGMDSSGAVKVAPLAVPREALKVLKGIGAAPQKKVVELRITLRGADAKPWQEWTLACHGKPGAGRRRGAILLLDLGRDRTLARLRLTGVAAVRVENSGKDTTVDLSVECVELSVKAK